MTTFFIAVLFAAYNYFIQTSFVKSTIQSDTKIMADIVFENLFIAMQRGSNKEELDAIIEKTASKMKNTQINLYNKTQFEALPSLREILQNKSSLIVQEDGFIHFYTPILYEAKCVTCHYNAQAGEIARIMHFASPLSDVKISLEDLMLMLLALFCISISVLFAYWFFILNRYFAYPIKHLLKQMTQIITHDQLKHKIKINARIKEIEQIEIVFNKQNKKLLESYQELERISNTDKLTGVANRKKFEETMQEYKEKKELFCLVLVDLNRFKIINDMYGHHIGDMVLIEFATIVNKFIRTTDTLFRIGGDEFIILLPHTNKEGTEVLITKIEEHLKSTSYNFEKYQLRLSASFGIVEYIQDGLEFSELLHLADERMYKDKQAKHRV
jgi:diguanylate cyclase (GGDEF)-like protein